MMSDTQAKSLLLEFLTGFPELSKDAAEKLSEMIPVIAPKKGNILVEQGKIPKECYFVLQGMVREYSVVDGNERTTEFYTESNGTVSSAHYTNQTQSDSYLECAEDCLLIAGNPEIDEDHMKQFPELLEITRKILEQDLHKSKEKHSNFILSSPRERYLHFLKTRSDLAHRVPLHQVASYLGMTPESLSRIRKRLVSGD